ETVEYILPDKRIKFKTGDIYKMEKDFSYAGVGYYIFFYDEKHKQRHIKLNYISGDDELMGYLQKKTGIKVLREGTFDVEKEQRPAVKVLKIIWNIIITFFLAWIVVLWPFISHFKK
ncbi:MAG: hypothetical protein HQL23_06940, partial [Candidatus Omnitrophica bacterium]|nr:hypothetical protein [Candidatus Omnitrophota bacterium]